MADALPGVPDWPSRVRRRDGRLVPFDKARITAAVQRAQAAIGEDDPGFASAVADVVTMTLLTRARRAAATARGVLEQEPAGATLAGDTLLPGLAPPTIESLQDLVEEALVEMGRAKLAKAYILYREGRNRAREALEVVARPDSSARSARMPQVRDRSGTQPWNSARIVAALVTEAELPRELAEEVAERVEQRVFDAGLRRLTTALLREFVDNELGAMGLDAALRRQEPVGIPRHDLRQLLLSPPVAEPDPGEVAPSPLPLRAALGAELFERYAVEDVLGGELAELQLDGTLCVEDLGAPHLPLVRSLPAELFAPRAAAPHALFEALAQLSPLLAASAGGVVLEGLGRLVGSPGRAGMSLVDGLVAMGTLARATGRQLDLSAPGGRGGALVARLLRELEVLATQALPAPRLYLSYEELVPALEVDPGLTDAVERLLATARLVPIWHGRSERWVAPGCRRRGRERVALACAGAVALNLPRLARRAGPWREDLFFEEVAGAVRQAVSALEALDRFQVGLQGAGSTGLRERRSFALSPVGLAEALRILGDGEARPDQGARVLGLIGEAARRFAAPLDLDVTLSSLFGARARSRFALRDERGPRAAQARLFADMPMPESEPMHRYSSGFSLGSGGPLAAARTQLVDLLATVRAGALHPLPAESGAGRLVSWGAHARSRGAEPLETAVSSTPTPVAPTGSSGSTGPLFDL